MTVKLSTTARNNRLASVIADLGNGALIEIRTTPRPANVAAAATGTLLATLTGGSPFAPAPSGGSATANAITQDSAADATGAAAWARIYKATGPVAVIDIDVTATGGGGELELVTTSIVTGQPVQITSLTLNEGGA